MSNADAVIAGSFSCINCIRHLLVVRLLYSLRCQVYAVTEWLTTYETVSVEFVCARLARAGVIALDLLQSGPILVGCA